MSAQVGRKILLKRDGTVLAGVRTKSVAINREAIDITNDDDIGFRNLLAEPGERQVDLTVSGITVNSILRDASFEDPAVLEDLSLEYPDGSKIEGDFFLASYTENAEYNDAVSFDATLNSAGVIAYTEATS
jgi:TP901-1 family phage major tail protein